MRGVCVWKREQATFPHFITKRNVIILDRFLSTALAMSVRIVPICQMYRACCPNKYLNEINK